MKLAVASGKGGTGKSTVSTNLSYILSTKYQNIVLIDCDVEEPNCHIFFKSESSNKEKVYTQIPEIIENKCTGCGKCAELCQFNALAAVRKKIVVFPELCHNCGGCQLICPEKAINYIPEEIGLIESSKFENLCILTGKLKIGVAMSPPLIEAVKEKGLSFNIQILDCPPGTSCPVIASVDDADYVFMVTEPTPFGLHDLKLAADVMKKLNKKFGIIINKSSENDYIIEEYAKSENIMILTKIPDSRKIAECYSRGGLAAKELPEFANYFEPLIKIIEDIKI